MSRPVRQARSVARLGAVQALYQMDVSGQGADLVVREFHEHRFERDLEGSPLAAADEAWFGAVVRGVAEKQGEVDKAIGRRLASGWKLARLDATVRAILRAGAFELMFLRDVPIEIVIDEYVEVAKSFFEGPEPGFVNGALDGISIDERSN